MQGPLLFHVHRVFASLHVDHFISQVGNLPELWPLRRMG